MGMHCWPGYKKKGTHSEYGRTYNTCVRSGSTKKGNGKSKHGK